ncbi:response regulator [Brevibacterium spongiae]|uniref:Response regulator transcription factor n=1 Tax=Brevibacterium spongiae TaxID=2909672 RepID=A0ABY5SQW3_9MICO|nr:response regulator transcription factor [Brevibacterium spongiae]UVI36877.1 response regulator transcription factor [Brevibacterium spongiae]
MTEPIRVVLVDDQELVRAGLRPLAERDGDIIVIAEAADGRAGLSFVRELRPDIVLMDIRMPVMDGIEATGAIVSDAELDGVRVLMLTTFDEDENVFAAIRTGAAGYLLKDVSADDLRGAIRTVAAGDALLSPSVTAAVMRAVAEGGPSAADDRGLEGLTEREVEVLSGIGRGLTNDEIAAELFLSPATARTYVSRLLTRLDARDRAALIVLAYETGLVRPGGRSPR